MDPLSEILAQLDFKGMLYFSTEFTPPWGVRVPADPNVIHFHMVTRGVCYVRLEGDATAQALRSGDFVLVSRGEAHDLMHDISARPRDLHAVMAETGYNGSGTLIYRMSDHGQETRLVCGHFRFSERASGRAFLGEMPSLFVVRKDEIAVNEWLHASINLLEHEQDRPMPGRDAVVRHVTEILFVQALRLWIDRERVSQSLVKALSDKRIAKAIGAVHASPNYRWSVEELARTSGLSRTAFAERFQKLTGLTPLQYVTDWRLTRARSMLQHTDQSVDEVAEAVGYQSSAAFSRVYTRKFGEGPGATRRLVRRRAS